MLYHLHYIPNYPLSYRVYIGTYSTFQIRQQAKYRFMKERDYVLITDFLDSESKLDEDVLCQESIMQDQSTQLQN